MIDIFIKIELKSSKMQEEPQKKGKFLELQEQIDKNLLQEWTNEQEYIRSLIKEENDNNLDVNTLDLVAGVDLSASKTNGDFACCCLTVFSCKQKGVVYENTSLIKISQAYVPGYLAFRQVPPLYALFKQLKAKKPQFWPELLLVDGNGILHQNRCGLASHLGVLLDLPCIGVGKTLFYIDGLDKIKVKQLCTNTIHNQGDHCFLKGTSGKVWGAALRNTKQAVNPIFVSIGHKIDLPTSIQCVIKLSIYRVVEPIRLADKRSRQIIEKADLSLAHKYPKYQMIYLAKK